MKTLYEVENVLRASKRQWRWKAALTIQDIPAGYICTYAEIAAETLRRTGLSISPRNIAWLRKHLYAITNRNTNIPIHRLAKAHDARCEADSERTRRETKQMRSKEGSWTNPRWWRFPSTYHLAASLDTDS